MNKNQILAHCNVEEENDEYMCHVPKPKYVMTYCDKKEEEYIIEIDALNDMIVTEQGIAHCGEYYKPKWSSVRVFKEEKQKKKRAKKGDKV